jgi:MFS family permease
MLTLLRRRSFGLVWGGGLVSLAGDWALITGLPLVVYQMTGSTLALGLTLMANSLPRLAFASIAGVFVDRWDRRRTMFITDVLLGLALLPLLLVTSAERLWLLALVLLVESTIVQFYRPAEGALLPRLVGEDELVTANALTGLNMNIARLGGPPLGALLVALSGLLGVVLVDAASFFVAAVALALVDVDALPALGKSRGRNVAAVWREWLDGLHLVRTGRAPCVIFAFIAITGFGEGIISTLFVPFATRVLHGNELTYGALLSAQAIGGLLGSLALGRFGVHVAPTLLLGFGGALLGVIDLLIFYAPLVTPVVLVPLLLMVVVGGPAAAISTGYLTLVQTTVADAFRGRLLGLLFATLALTGLAGMGLAGLLGDKLGIIPLLTIDCVAYVLAGALVLVVLGSTAPSARSP